MQICILQHEPTAPAGYFGEWALAHGHGVSVLDVPALVDWPVPREYDLVVSLGSDRSVHASPEPWIPTEIDYLARVHRDGAPVFGICFGAQTLAAALGGRVKPAAKTRAEWREIETVDEASISRGPWLRWHEDVVELPAAARLLAGTEAEPLAFEAGSAVGLQFHPEATAEIVAHWVDSERQKLATQQIDATRLQNEIERGLDGARTRAFELFDAISARWPTRTLGRSTRGTGPAGRR